MKLFVSLEFRFFHLSSGDAYTKNSFPESFWHRYLAVYDEVNIIARSQKISEAEIHSLQLKKVTGDNIHFHPVPYYVGPLGYLKNYFKIKRFLKDMTKHQGAYIFRVASALGNTMASFLYKKGQPFGLEIVGNPQDTFRPGVFKHPLRPIFRWYFTRSLQQLCLKASAIGYVSKYTLQKVFPARKDAYQTNYSSIELTNEHLVTEPRTYSNFPQNNTINIIFIGSLEYMVKSPDTLIESLSILKNDSDFKYAIHLTMVGDGRERPTLESLAKELNVDEWINFKGQVQSGDPIRKILDENDIFVLTSRSEGLPRAMIEAMARGLPCIGASEGGIVELLEPSERVPIEDPQALAEMIKDFINDPQRLEKLSKENIKKSKEYTADILNQRRVDFYTYLKNKTLEYYQ